MKKLRWVMDGGFWDLDMSTPMTLDGIARAVPGDTLPLGVSRGAKLSRSRQIDFLQRFMFLPFVPSYAGDPAKGGEGFTLQQVLTFPFGGENWFGTVLGQFNVQRLVSSMGASASTQPQESSLLKNIRRCICDKSLYGLGLCGEFFIGHDDTLLVSSELYGEDKKSVRNKAVFNHKFPQHNLTVETVWPGLFVDQDGSFWDVPLSMGIDLASVASDSGSSYHLSFNHNSGAPKKFGGDVSDQIPRTLLPDFSVKSAMSVKKNIDIWRSKAGKLRMVQPFDVFLSEPHVSASGCIGTVVTASLGENSVGSQGENDSKDFGSFSLRGLDNKSALLADFFTSVSCTAQYGNFQRLFFDLTRIHARLDFPSGLKFVTGAAHAADAIYNSKQPNLDALQAICPDITVSLQQQIFGELSFRVDSRLTLDLKSGDRFAHVNDTVFAVEYALKVLGSAKAVAWYSPKTQEAMVELRFFET